MSDLKKPSPVTPQIAQDIAAMTIARLGENVHSILLYGSSCRDVVYWDLDLLIILDAQDSPVRDLQILRSVVQAFPGHELDFQVMYAHEVRAPNTFSLDAHGAFFSHVLAQAVVLYGVNPFYNYYPSETVRITSLLNRIQRYIFQVRQEYVGIGRYVRDKNPQYHKKHLRRVLFDLLLIFRTDVTHDNVVDLFSDVFPDVCTIEMSNIFESDTEDLETYLGVYEAIYKIGCEYVGRIVPDRERTIQKGVYEGIFFEWVLPEVSTDRAIILLDGLPRTPELRSLMNLLASWGYAVFFPRVEGTWESHGVFLSSDPSIGIRAFADAIHAGTACASVMPFRDITVIGTSFGGLVALGAGLSTCVNRVIALSPVLSPHSLKNADTLNTFLKSTYVGAYRYTDEGWSNFLSGRLIDFTEIRHHPAFDPLKYRIAVGEYDDHLDAADIIDVCRSEGIRVESVPAEHLTLHKDIVIIRPLLNRLLG